MMLFYHFPICIIYIFKFTNCFCQLKNFIEILIVRLNRMGNPAAQTMRNGRTREEGVRGRGPGKSVATPLTMLGQGTANRPEGISLSGWVVAASLLGRYIYVSIGIDFHVLP